MPIGIRLSLALDHTSSSNLDAVNNYIASLNPVLDYRFNETSGTTAINYGSAGSAVNGTYANSPTLNQSGILGSAVSFDGSNDYLEIPNNSSWADLATFEWMYIYKIEKTSANTLGRIMGSDGDYAFGAGIKVAGVKRVALSNTTPTIFSTDAKYLQPTAVWCGYNWNYDDVGDRRVRMYINGLEEPIYNAQAAVTGTFNKYQVPIRLFQREFDSTAIVGGVVNRWLLFSRKLTSVERNTILAYYGLQNPVYTRQVICTGDSLTSGQSGQNNCYPCQLAGLLISDSAVKAYGVSGEGAGTIIPKAATREDLDINTLTGAEDILVAWVGLVDLYGGAASATVQTNYETYCAARQAAGFKVIACTITPSNSVSVGYETRRQEFNTWLRANYTDFADGLADMAADSRIGDANDYTDTVYYIDGLHMTTAGYAIAAQIVADAINSL